MYAGLGLSAIVFVLHGIFLHGWSVQNQRMSLDWMILMACLNLAGGTIYAARVSGPYSTDVTGLIFDRFLRSGAPTPLISLAVVTRFFISWLYSPASPTWPDCSELSTMSVLTRLETTTALDLALEHNS